MLCKFCQHDFDDSLTECPYCHRQVDFEPKNLTREERDSFAGTTIEMEGSFRDKSHAYQGEYQDRENYYQREDVFRRADGPYENNKKSPGFKVYHLNGLSTWIIFAMVVLGIIFFILPAFLVIGVIGTLAGIIVIFLSRLFR